MIARIWRVRNILFLGSRAGVHSVNSDSLKKRNAKTKRENETRKRNAKIFWEIFRETRRENFSGAGARIFLGDRAGVHSGFPKSLEKRPKIKNMRIPACSTASADDPKKTSSTNRTKNRTTCEQLRTDGKTRTNKREQNADLRGIGRKQTGSRRGGPRRRSGRRRGGYATDAIYRRWRA